MKSVLISIRPKWCEKIASGQKTIEVRKSAPKEVPFKAYIYETKGETETPWVDEDGHFIYKGRGQVVGEFVCDKVIRTCGWRLRGDTQKCAKRTTDEETFPELACLTIDEIVKYAGSENREVCGWHISDLKIYDKPKELSEFCIPCKTNCENCKKPLFYDCWKEKGKIKVITRPPQSWQYVEELENVK